MTSCLAVYHNPFSTATTNPKIPDGKVYASTGLRLQSVTEATNDDTGVMDILMYPGLNAGCAIASTEDGDVRHMIYSDHGTFEGTSTLSQTGAVIHKWRVVSQALKITLVNNSDENDGWFEAIRVQGSRDSGFAALTGGEVGSERTIVGASSTTELPGVATSNLVEHPTYITGKLRDIHRYLFHLMPQGNDHDFNMIDRTFDNTTAAGSENFVDHCLDNESYDMVFIRVHGRAGSSPTRLMLHLVCNQEVVYDEQSFMTRYHSEARGNNAVFQRSKRARQQNGENTRAGKRPKTQLIQSAVG